MAAVNGGFPFPVELDQLIMSFVAHSDEFTDRAIRWKTIQAHSLTCRRFRALALPHLFAHFSTENSHPDMKDFCQAWTSGEKAAIDCAQYIKGCFLNYTQPQLPHQHDIPEPPSHVTIANRYLSSFTSLSNLITLRMALGRPDMNLESFQRLLETAPIESLCIVNATGQGESLFETAYVEELSRILSNHATVLKELNVIVPDFMFDLSILSHAKFQLESLVLKTSIKSSASPQNLQRFLSAMSSITTLRFDCNVGGSELLSGLSNSDLPHLHTLLCPFSCVPPLLNGLRPIRSLELEIQQTTISGLSVVAFMKALRRSAHTIRELLGLPLALATASLSEHTPHLEHISVVVVVWNQAGFDASIPPDLHEDVSNAIDKIGRIGNVKSRTPQVCPWPHLSKFELRLRNRSPLSFDQGIQIYSLNLTLQRSDLRVLTRRFPALTSVVLGRHTRWTRPPDLPKEWKVRVVQSELHLLEEMAQDMDKMTRHFDNPLWPRWDYNGVVIGILALKSR